MTTNKSSSKAELVSLCGTLATGVQALPDTSFLLNQQNVLKADVIAPLLRYVAATQKTDFVYLGLGVLVGMAIGRLGGRIGGVSIALAVFPRWKTTPCSSCNRCKNSPICGPSTRSIGRCSGATTCTSSPRARNDAATSSPMKLAPITTARCAPFSPAMIARQSAKVRSVCTFGWFDPGKSRRTGSAPVASSSRS